LSWSIAMVRCTSCNATYEVRDGIVDFAPGRHFDRFTPADALRETHLDGLQLEVDGSRRRITDFYAPFIRRHLPEAQRVLDCGCGNGVSVDVLAAHGYEAWGNDLSELRAWQWRQRSARDRLVIADGRALPFPDAYFDVVLSSGVIEHIGVIESATPRYTVRTLPDRREQRTAFLRELARVTRPGGLLFVDAPNGAFPIDFWHGDAPGRARWHSLREAFLPRFSEIRRAARSVLPGAAIHALSPYRRLQFNQAGRHWYGRLLAPAGSLAFRLMQFLPFRWLARTALNPFLVVQITKTHT
jgi:SAM-dependent methyltransferase